jgi:cytoskeletal protein CcmA (bactofilin family)
VILKKLFSWERPKRRRSMDTLGPCTSQLGAGFLFRGTLTGEGVYQVQGEVVGDGNVKGSVLLASGSYWKGELEADFVQIAGRLDGNVTAREKIDLAPTAVMTGNITSPVVVIAEGAQLEGTIRRPRKSEVKRYSERRGRGPAGKPGEK